MSNRKQKPTEGRAVVESFKSQFNVGKFGLIISNEFIIYKLRMNSKIQEVETLTVYTVQKMAFSVKEYFSKNEQTRKKLRNCSHLLHYCYYN